jgi:hypothetical protein
MRYILSVRLSIGLAGKSDVKMLTPALRRSPSPLAPRHRCCPIAYMVNRELFTSGCYWAYGIGSIIRDLEQAERLFGQ